MNNWLESEIYVDAVKNRELRIEDKVISKTMINLEDIFQFYESNNRDTEEEGTGVTFYGGHETYLIMPYSEFKKKFLAYLESKDSSKNTK